MASTNKTTHYKLPQYIGSDKPTYLGDMNEAYLKIDTAIYNASETAKSALNSVENSANDLSTAVNQSSANKNEINVLKGNLNTLSRKVDQNKITKNINSVPGVSTNSTVAYTTDSNMIAGEISIPDVGNLVYISGNTNVTNSQRISVNDLLGSLRYPNLKSVIDTNEVNLEGIGFFNSYIETETVGMNIAIPINLIYVDGVYKLSTFVYGENMIPANIISHITFNSFSFKNK